VAIWDDDVFEAYMEENFASPDDAEPPPGRAAEAPGPGSGKDATAMPIASVARSQPRYDQAKVIAAVSAAVFGRVTTELLRAKGSSQREELATFGADLVAEIRRLRAAEQEVQKIDEAQEELATRESEEAAVEDFRRQLAERRLAG
jgi:hypothetical protein